MEDFISALQTNDLVKAKKAFGPIMLERTSALIEARKKEIAASVMIEGEEADEDEDDESEDKDDSKKDKDESKKDEDDSDEDEDDEE